MSNAFSGYIPQLSAVGMVKAQKMERKKSPLDAGNWRVFEMMPVPSRESINTDQRKPSDKTQSLRKARI